jgi:hypothetical protein
MGVPTRASAGWGLFLYVLFFRGSAYFTWGALIKRRIFLSPLPPPMGVRRDFVYFYFNAAIEKSSPDRCPLLTA